MRFIGFVAAILLLTSASAQEAPPQKFIFEVDQNELNAIAQGLNELPKRVADPLLQKLTIQLQAQAKANADKAKVETEKK